MSILGKAAKLLVAGGALGAAYAVIKHFAEPHESDALRPNVDPTCDDDRLNTLRKHWSSSAVMTDDYTSETKEQKIAEEDLLPGELSAVTFQIGCYTVRSAQCVYKIMDSSYDPENEPPADEAELKLLRAQTAQPGMTATHLPALRSHLRMVHEISARYKDTPQDKFTFICRAAHARNYSWSESIEAVCAVKENSAVADEEASLLVLDTYIGDSFDVDTWYKLDPDGRITTLKLHPFDSDMDNARFE